MVISNLQLKNYRNYKELNINFLEKTNIFFGDNAQGKTNILESILIASTGKSHRTSKDKELINFGGDSFNIKIQCESNSQKKKIEDHLYS